MTLHRPESLKDALDILVNAAGSGPAVVAGGTDLYPALRDGAAPAELLDVSAIAGLRGITRLDDGWRIGAATRWADVVAAELPPAFDGLKQAAREVGSVQIQNAGTVAGNICNASPAADGVPPLLTLDAIVELASQSGVRHLPLGEFILGPRRTALREGEIMTALMVPDQNGQGAFIKLGARRYLVISIAMVAARLVLDQGRMAQVALSVGAASPRAVRLPELEAALLGQPIDRAEEIIGAAVLPQVDPIDDVRASAAYRRDAVRTLLARVIAQASQMKEPRNVA